MITTILFDLDGTLVPMSGDDFQGRYFKLLTSTVAKYGYPPEKLMEWVWAGTKQMLKNDGSKTNYEAFWDKFSELTGKSEKEEVHKFDAFYLNEFDKAGDSLRGNVNLRGFIDGLKAQGYKLVLATNPLFPIQATVTRLKWLGLCTDDFVYITTMSNSSYTKPNLKYYETIFEHIGEKPEHCIMVGNNPTEDMCVQRLGCNVFLMTDYLENKENVDYSSFAQGGLEELKQFIDEVAQV